MRDDCCIVKLAFTIWAPIDLVWTWITADRDERDIEAQRRRLEHLAREHAAKMETTA